MVRYTKPKVTVAIVGIVVLLALSNLIISSLSQIYGQLLDPTSNQSNSSVGKITPIHLGNIRPLAVADNPNTGKIYVANMGSNNLSVIDAKTNNVTQVRVGAYPSAISVNPNTNKVYMTHFSSNAVSIMDGDSNNVTKVGVGKHPFAIAVNPTTNKIYVANTGSNTVSVIDAKTNNVTPVKVGNSPGYVAVNPNTNQVYVTDISSNTVYVIDGNTNNVTKVMAGSDNFAIAVNPTTNKVYVSSHKLNRLYLIDGNTNNVDIVPGITFYPLDISVNPNTNQVYVTNNNTVSVINSTTNKVAMQINVGFSYISHLRHIAVNPNTNQVYVTDISSNTVYVIDGNTNNAPIDRSAMKVGNAPFAIAVNPDTNRIYVANARSNTVSIIDGDSNNITQVKVGEHPVAIAVNPDTNKIYVANEISNTVSIIDGDTSKVTDKPVKVGVYPVAIAVNPNINQIYVANSVSNTTSLIDGNSTTIQVKVGERPVSIAVNPDTNKIYVANSVSNTVSVIDPKPLKDAKAINASIKTIQVGLDPRVPNSSRYSNPTLAQNLDINPNTKRIYVTDRSSNNTVSVINEKTNNVTHIKVGFFPSHIAINSRTNLVYIPDFGGVSVIDDNIVGYSFQNATNTIMVNQGIPSAIAVNPNTNKVYMAYLDSNTVAIIDGDTKNVTQVRVGSDTFAIAVNPNTNKIYIPNMGSNTVSVIDGNSNNVVAGIIFNISPYNAGRIKCNNQESPTKQYIYSNFGTQCMAEPNKGFQFTSWIEDSGHKSTKTVSTSTVSTDSPFNSFLSVFGLFHPNDNAARLNITHYGNFTANFEKVAPPIPPEYWIPLYGIIVSSIVGWSIPSIIGWLKAINQRRRLQEFHIRISKICKKDGKLDLMHIESLDELRRDVTDAFVKGKISEQHYDNLKNEVSILYERAYKNKIYSLNSKFDSSNGIQLDKIKNDITDAYAEGKISEQHFNLLNGKISDYKNNQKSVNDSSSFEDQATSIAYRSPIKANKRE